MLLLLENVIVKPAEESSLPQAQTKKNIPAAKSGGKRGAVELEVEEKGDGKKSSSKTQRKH